MLTFCIFIYAQGELFIYSNLFLELSCSDDFLNTNANIAGKASYATKVIFARPTVAQMQAVVELIFCDLTGGHEQVLRTLNDYNDLLVLLPGCKVRCQST
jgi:hypothetical protein